MRPSNAVIQWLLAADYECCCQLPSLRLASSLWPLGIRQSLDDSSGLRRLGLCICSLRRAQVRVFEAFLDPRMSDHRLRWEYSNPNYTLQWEFFLNATHRATQVRRHGGVR